MSLIQTPFPHFQSSLTFFGTVSDASAAVAALPPLPDSHPLSRSVANGQWRLRRNAARLVTFPFHFASNDFT